MLVFSKLLSIAAFEIWRVEILCKIDLQKTVEIHSDNLDCKAFNLMKIPHYWLFLCPTWYMSLTRQLLTAVKRYYQPGSGVASTNTITRQIFRLPNGAVTVWRQAGESWLHLPGGRLRCISEHASGREPEYVAPHKGCVWPHEGYMKYISYIIRRRSKSLKTRGLSISCVEISPRKE